MRDRLIQLIALTVLAGGIIASFMLTPTINRERVDRQISYDIEVGDDANPAYTFLAALGSFRGVAVNALWQRAEQLKQEGKFFEANNLAEMITTLQPRYPEAWNFHGWNMAYNISVKCKTKEERWDWVQKGMALIRDRGIPNNPNGVVLYRSLGWILGHKMAGQTDDFHWYYKERWVDTWQTLLGEYHERGDFKSEYKGDNQPTRADFNPLIHADWAANDRMGMIADAADTYFLRPGRGEIDKQEKDKELQRDYNASNYFDTLSPDKLAQFYSDNPGLESIVRELEALTGPNGEELGLGLNVKTLKAFGRLMVLEDAGYWMANPAVVSPETVGIEGVALREWFVAKQQDTVLVRRPFIDPELIREDLKQQQIDAKVVNLLPMLDLLRAQAIIADYHMDPAYMHYCMERFGPIDWRHPSSHAVYWTALGMRRAEEWKHNQERIDVINLNRATIHALQDLAHNGKISYRPQVEALGAFGQSRIHYAADTRMIPAYEKAVDETRKLVSSKEFGDHKTDTYDMGHENFLQSAVVLYHFNGDDLKARIYYKRLQDEYSEDDPRVAKVADYKLTSIEDFARIRLEDGLGFLETELISYWIRRAWSQGIASRDPAVLRRNLASAKQNYDKHLEDRTTNIKNDADVKGRQDLAPFGEMVVIHFLAMLEDPSYSIVQKSGIWRMGGPLLASLEAQVPLAMIAYREMIPVINQQARVEGWAGDLQAMFPEPPGYQEWAQQLPAQPQPPRQPTPIRPTVPSR